jgi:dipeptidyl aminopeptidase/acylaminoacyl peptidase
LGVLRPARSSNSTGQADELSEVTSSRYLAASVASIVVLGVALAGLPERAAGTFPGANGRIVLEMRTVLERDDECLTPSCEERWLVAVDPRSGRRSPFDPCRDPVECWDLNPAVSPDGRRIAFERYGYSSPPVPGELASHDRFFLAVTGLGGRRVRLLAEPAFNPAWSPNGEWIAFSRRGGIDMVASDGGRVRHVLRGRASELDWSARGEIAFVRYRGARSDIYTVRPDGTRLRRATSGGVSSNPSWSPDGRSLAYMREARPAGGFRLDLYIRRGDRTSERIVQGGAFPAWSPDGRQIAFVRRGNLWLVRLRDGAQRPLRRVGDDDVASLAWRPRVRP